MPASKFVEIENKPFYSASDAAKELGIDSQTVHRRCVSSKWKEWRYLKEYEPKEMKCSKCNEVKSILEFPKHKGSRLGFRKYCKVCKNNSSKKWRDSNPDVVKDMNLKYFTGINLEKYNALFNEQLGKCAICGIHQKDLEKTLSVDHDHENGEIRGLLCSKCNFGLGLFNDDVLRLQKAINYLKK